LAFPGGAFVREKIGFLPAFELLLFFFLLLCFLSFFSVIRRLGRISAVGDASLEAKRLFVFNVASMFTAHALFLTVLICVMGRPISNPHLYVFFHRIIASFHSQDYALLSIKAAFLCILIPVLLYQINYLLSGKITFQNFCLLSLMGWAGLFAIGLNNLLHAILVLDALSFVTAALVALCAWRGFGRAVAFALHYYVLSALTSVLGLAGCIMIYSVFQTFDVNTIIFLAGGEATSRLVESPAFLIGVFLVMVKVMFLLGLFPFQHYVVEVCGAANFGLLGFFLIVAKFPVLIFSTSLLKLMWLHFDSFKNFLLLTALVSIVYSALHILSVLRVKEFFAYSSINQYGFIAVLFYFEDLYSFYLAFLIYFIYAISTVILLVFLSFSRGFGRAGLGDGDVDTLSDLVRLINDSYLFHRAANDGARPGPAMYFYGGALAGFIALATVAGLPPLAGFFAKLHYVEIFMKHGYYYTLSAILITTLFTMFAYFNVGSALFAEYRRMDANNFIYYPRISSIDDLGGVILAALSVILLLLAFSSADGSALSIMRKLTMPFM
jgi:NADH-quinone oxidoreductase subunit N